jgi:hypothetical protein
MNIVVPDSNAFHGARWLSSIAGRKLVDLAEAGACEVALPQVVVDELERQHREALSKQRDEARTALSEIDSIVNIDEIVAKFTQRLTGVSLERDALLSKRGIFAAPIPDNITRDLVRRDLQRRRPFIDNDTTKKRSYGFRDSVIWETLLELALSHEPQTTIYFVTKDLGFLNKNVSEQTLHPDLLADLDAHGIDESRVVVVDTFASVVEIINAAVAEAEAEAAEAKAASDPPDGEKQDLALLLRGYAINAAHRAEMVQVSLNALNALVGKEIAEKPGFGGHYESPDFVQFTYPDAIDNATIVAIDLESDFAFDPPNGDIVTAGVDVVLSINGDTRKADYFVADADLELVGELNDYYFETSTFVHARATIKIDIEGGLGHFESEKITLEDNKGPGGPNDLSSVELDIDLASEADAKLATEPTYREPGGQNY